MADVRSYRRKRAKSLVAREIRLPTAPPPAADVADLGKERAKRSGKS